MESCPASQSKRNFDTRISIVTFFSQGKKRVSDVWAFHGLFYVLFENKWFFQKYPRSVPEVFGTIPDQLWIICDQFCTEIA